MVTLPEPAVAARQVKIDDQGVSINFPEGITFSAHIESDTEIEQVALQYGVDKRACGDGSATAFPAFHAGTSADVSWTWDMLKLGAQPPGATLWYSWRVTDKSGHETVSEPSRVLWLDSVHKWNSISSGGVTLHSYAATARFAQELLDSALGSLKRLERTTG